MPDSAHRVLVGMRWADRPTSARQDFVPVDDDFLNLASSCHYLVGRLRLQVMTGNDGLAVQPDDHAGKAPTDVELRVEVQVELNVERAAHVVHDWPIRPTYVLAIEGEATRPTFVVNDRCRDLGWVSVRAVPADARQQIYPSFVVSWALDDRIGPSLHLVEPNRERLGKCGSQCHNHVRRISTHGLHGNAGYSSAEGVSSGAVRASSAAPRVRHCDDRRSLTPVHQVLAAHRRVRMSQTGV